MIRKFEHGILCLRNKDFNVVNMYPSFSNINKYKLTKANLENQVFKEHNPLLAPRALADWSYNE